MKESLKHLLPPDEILEHEKDIQGKTPLWAHWEHYVTTRERLGKSLFTVRSVRDGLRVIIRYTGLCTVEQFNDPQLFGEKLLEFQEKRNQQASTRNTYIKNANTYFIWLEKNGYIAKNKIRQVERSKEKYNEQRVLSEREISKLIFHLHSRNYAIELEKYRNIFLIDLLRYTGARPCEILDMHLNSVYSESGKMRIVIDGRKQKGRLRYYACPQFLRDSYRRYIECRGKYQKKGEYLFVSASSNGKWTTSGLRCFFKKISRELGFQVNSYAFRRFVASKLNEEGVAMLNIARHLGHTRTSTTERYIERSCILTHESSETMERIANGLSSKHEALST